jgi:hypothetical protein
VDGYKGGGGADEMSTITRPVAAPTFEVLVVDDDSARCRLAWLTIAYCGGLRPPDPLPTDRADYARARNSDAPDREPPGAAFRFGIACGVSPQLSVPSCERWMKAPTC